MTAGLYTRPGHHPQLPDAVAKQVCQLIEPGDVLICRKEYAVTNYFLPGYWKHAALYLGTPSQLQQLGIAEHENVRPRLAAEQVAEALARGLFHEGRPYDFDFDFTRGDRLVCTEVVYRSYDGIGNMGFELTSRAGRLTLSAEDLVEMAVAGRHFDPLAVFSPVHCPQLAVGNETEPVLKLTRP